MKKIKTNQNIILTQQEHQLIELYVETSSRSFRDKEFKNLVYKVLSVIKEYRDTKEGQEAIISTFEEYGIEFNKEETATLFYNDEKELEEIIKKNKFSKQQILKATNKILKNVYYNNELKANSIQDIFKELIHFKNKKLMEFKTYIDIYIVSGDFDKDVKNGVYNQVKDNEKLFMIKFFESINNNIRKVTKEGDLVPLTDTEAKFRYENDTLMFNMEEKEAIDIVYMDKKNNVYAMDVTSDETGRVDYIEEKKSSKQPIAKHAELFKKIQHDNKKYFFISLIPKSINTLIIPKQNQIKVSNKRVNALLQELVKHYHLFSVGDEDTTKEFFQDMNNTVNTFVYQATGHNGFKIMDTTDMKYSCEDITELFVAIKELKIEDYNKSNIIKTFIDKNNIKNNIDITKTKIYQVAKNINEDVLHGKTEIEQVANHLELLASTIMTIIQNKYLLHFLITDLYFSLQFNQDKIKLKDIKLIYDNTLEHFKKYFAFKNITILKKEIINGQLNEELNQLEEQIIPLNNKVNQLEEQIIPLNNKVNQLEEEKEQLKEEKEQLKEEVNQQIINLKIQMCQGLFNGFIKQNLEKGNVIYNLITQLKVINFIEEQIKNFIIEEGENELLIPELTPSKIKKILKSKETIIKIITTINKKIQYQNNTLNLNNKTFNEEEIYTLLTQKQHNNNEGMGILNKIKY